MMNKIPNILSFLRIPLAFLFLSDNLTYRLVAIIGAMATDFLDGLLARRFRCESRIGASLDPITDKFFVLFVLGVLIQEERLALWQAATMLSRDVAVFTFGAYLWLAGEWEKYRVQAIWAGKVMTTLQLFVLLALTLGYTVPSFTYFLFVLIGVWALLELIYVNKRKLGNPSINF